MVIRKIRIGRDNGMIESKTYRKFIKELFEKDPSYRKKILSKDFGEALLYMTRMWNMFNTKYFNHRYKFKRCTK